MGKRMTPIDYTALSYGELIEEKQRIDAALVKVQARKKADLMAEVTAMVEKKGFSLDDVLTPSGKRRYKRRKARAASKHVNPDNPSQTWSGMGRPPNWYKEMQQR